MLEYKKRILMKVSFSEEIFERELAKAKDRLEETELEKLREWCSNTFSNEFVPIMEKVFGTPVLA